MSVRPRLFNRNRNEEDVSAGRLVSSVSPSGASSLLEIRPAATDGGPSHHGGRLVYLCRLPRLFMAAVHWGQYHFPLGASVRPTQP